MKGNGFNLAPVEGSSSGGYLLYIMKYAVSALFGIKLSTTDIEKGQNGITIVPGRNHDFTSVNFTLPGHQEPVLKFAYAYGFRNIQNLVRKVKTKGSIKKEPAFHFVEIMACPSGCINGGGQLKPNNESTNITSQEWISKSDNIYRQDAGLGSPDQVLEISKENLYNFLDTWIGNDILLSKEMFHTEYHVVEGFTDGLTVKW